MCYWKGCVFSLFRLYVLVVWEGEYGLKHAWKFYLGIAFLTMSCFLPLLGFVVPVLGLPLGLSSVVMALLMVGGPEIMIILVVIFLGKDVYNYIKKKSLLFLREKDLLSLSLNFAIIRGCPYYLQVAFPSIWMPIFPVGYQEMRVYDILSW